VVFGGGRVDQCDSFGLGDLDSGAGKEVAWKRASLTKWEENGKKVGPAKYRGETSGIYKK